MLYTLTLQLSGRQYAAALPVNLVCIRAFRDLQDSKDGPRLVDRGRRKYVIKDTSNGTVRAMNVNVTDVKKPLLAVADLNDKGYDVHFLRTSAFAQKDDGQRIDFVRRNGIFEYDVEVMPHRTFPGQPRA